MTFVQLEYFLSVVNTGSFSEAAQRCFVTQPTLSVQIKNLELELDTVLLDRSRQPVVPTRIGELVAQKARQVLCEVDELKELVSEEKGEVKGELRLGVVPSVAPFLIHRFMPVFKQACPDVDLRIFELQENVIEQFLSCDLLDAAIMSSGSIRQNFNEIPLLKDTFYLYLSQDNKLLRKTHVKIEDVRSNADTLVVMSEGDSLRNQVVEICQLPDEYFGTNLTASTLSTLFTLVDSTNGFAVIPEMSIEAIEERKRKNVRELQNGTIFRMIVLVSRRTEAKRRVLEILADIITENAI